MTKGTDTPTAPTSPQFAEQIWKTLIALVKHAETTMPDVPGKTKKQQVVDWVAQLVNWGEGLIPVFKWANLPVVDELERLVIGLGVEWAWTQLQLPADQQVKAIRNVNAASPAQLRERQA